MLKKLFNKSTLTGGEVVFKKLIDNNVKDVFIFSGGSVMPIVDPFYKNREINYFVNTHEQNCGHAATGYAKLSGKPGVCLVTSGPGITNMITPMLDAKNDSTPLVVISGQVPINVKGTNAFQEAPALQLTKHVTKKNFNVTNISDIPKIIDEAFDIANSGKKGPVHIDIPKCVSSSTVDIDFIKKIENMNEYIKKQVKLYYSDDDINYKIKVKNIADFINKSKRPILYLGQGCIDSYHLLRRFASKANIPVTSTIHGCGIFDENESLSLEWCGMHGSAAANYALQKADCIIALGSRFDDRTTGLIEKYAPIARKNKGIIHVNIENKEINKVIKSNYNLVSDCDKFLNNIIPFTKFQQRKEWINIVNNLKDNNKFVLKTSKKNDNFHMEEVIDCFNNKTKDKDVLFTTGVGNHQMQTYQFIKCQYPKKILSSGSLGVMGAGLPYAIGAQIANKNKLVILIDGDSSFNMTMSDMKTIVEHKLPIKIAIMNNNSQMMVTIWEKLFFNERYTATINERNPNYVYLAESFGIKGMHCGKHDNLEEKIDEFINFNGPVLCEFDIKRDICLPLVGPGKALDDMILPENYTLKNKIVSGLVPS